LTVLLGSKTPYTITADFAFANLFHSLFWRHRLWRTKRYSPKSTYSFLLERDIFSLRTDSGEFACKNSDIEGIPRLLATTCQRSSSPLQRGGIAEVTRRFTVWIQTYHRTGDCTCLTF
jgi:hypothetical protein